MILMAMFFVSVVLEKVVAGDDDYYGGDDDDDYMGSEAYVEENEEEEEEVEEEDVFDDDRFQEPYTGEWYMVLVFTLLFGFFITLFGAVVGYFSVLEDQLMHLYKSEGELVRAEVISLEFARGFGASSCCGGGASGGCYHHHCSYNIFVVYDRDLAENYRARIRKQSKARDCDFIRMERPESPGMISQIRLIDPIGSGLESPSIPASPIPSYRKPSGEIPNNGNNNNNNNNNPLGRSSSLFGLSGPNSNNKKEEAKLVFETTLSSGVIGERMYLPMYVLPLHPKSAYPVAQVERACAWQYRLWTVALVIFDLLLATLCAFFAANAVIDMDDEDRQRIGWYAIGIFLAIILLELPLIHYCCHDLFLAALKEDYLESGEYIPLDRREDDDSTLSTRDDVYLTNRMRSAKIPHLGSPLSSMS